MGTDNTKFKNISEIIIDEVKKGNKILILSHLDADGLASGSILFECLRRAGANVTLRIFPELDTEAIRRVKDSRYDFFIFADLGSSLIEEMAREFGDRFVLIDHHIIDDSFKEERNILNAWNIGYDGGKEACTSTLAYFVAKTIDHRNLDLSVLSIVGSVADRQDCGEKHSLISLNRKALDDSLRAGYISIIEDLILPGRETRPVHESLALMSYPYIPGFSGNRDSVYSALVNAGLQLKVSGHWKTVSELTKEEKSVLIEVILSQTQKENNFSLNELIGEVYTLEFEDRLSPLRDAREFATLLNACGRMDRQDLGIAVCLGERGEQLKEAILTLYEYRNQLNKIVQSILFDESKLIRTEQFVVIRGHELVNDKLLAPVASIISSSPGFRDKIIIAIARSGSTNIKISLRLGKKSPSRPNLGIIASEVARTCNGTGGGHSMAAGAKIPIEKENSFLGLFLERIENESKVKA